MWRKSSLYSWAHSVNSDRQWPAVGSSVLVKSACVFIPCQVKSTKRTTLVFIYMIPSKCVKQHVYKMYINEF